MRALRGGGVLLVAILMLSLVPGAEAAKLPAGTQRITYMVGPLKVTPGQNRIAYHPIREKPQVDGWITRIKPNLVNADGSVPNTDQVMFHHGVWVNLSGGNATSGLPELFFAAGEEKTIFKLPKGYGYRYHAKDNWLLNHMIHNLTPRAMQLYVTYTIDFIPDTAPAAKSIQPVRPIWMDVENGRLYPVFDVYKGAGRKGKFTYPDDAVNPYRGRRQRNKWTVDRDGVLVATAGHVHAGGLYTDMYLNRPGAIYAGPRCSARPTAAKRRSCRAKAPNVNGSRAHLFRSEAKYFEPAGPVSWDVSMTATPANWRVAVKKGDTLEINATYETKRAGWFESMGIMVVFMADGNAGKDPYRSKVDYKGKVTHGHLKENNVHGGKKTKLPDPRKLPAGPFSPGPLSIDGFSYQQGDLRRQGDAQRPPTVKQGQSLRFELGNGDARQEIWHSLSSCKAPCNRSTGIAYPIPDGKFFFDSGQLGTVRPPTVGRKFWDTPKALPKGTYTYFCRIHPFMRGAFRVTP